MAEEQNPVPEMDHGGSEANQGLSEDALLDSILANSAMAEAAGYADQYEESIPVEEVDEEDPSDSTEEEDPEEVDEDVTDEDVEEEGEETEDEDSTDTQEAEVYTLDDLDEEALFTVKVDGEEINVPLADLVKNYQTDASISNKGRELGEARKALEAERAEAIEQLQQVGQASQAVLMRQEQAQSEKYHKLKAKLDGMDRDDYDYREVKDELEDVQKAYWNARREREGLQEAVAKHTAEKAQQEQQARLQHFANTIGDYVPDFNEEVATNIREFALGEGLNEDVLESIVDPTAIKLLYDYMSLKNRAKQGQAKRKAVPTKKAVPAKKAKGKQQKQKDKEAMTKARAFREDASKDDQMAFLKQLANNSLSKL